MRFPRLTPMSIRLFPLALVIITFVSFPCPTSLTAQDLPKLDPLDLPAAKKSIEDAKKLRFEMMKQIATKSKGRNQLVKSGTDVTNLDLALGFDRNRVAQLSLRIAEAGNVLQPNSTPPAALEVLKRETLVRWGSSVQGIQIGVERFSLQDSYAPGDPVHFRRRVRNATEISAQATVRFTTKDKVNCTLFSSGRVVATWQGPVAEKFDVQLEPETDQAIPETEFAVDTTHLLPGTYYVDCLDRFALNDTTIAADQIVVSSPSSAIPSDQRLGFEIVAPNSKPDEFTSVELEGSADQFWAPPVQGLQAALRYTRDLAHPDEMGHRSNWEWNLNDVVKGEVLVRNTTDQTIPISFVVDKDDSLIELDPYGHTVQFYERPLYLMPRFNKSRVAWADGHAPTDRYRNDVLKPGKTIVVATFAFRLFPKPKDEKARLQPPRENLIVVEPATKYALHTRIKVRGKPSHMLSLPTGRARLWVLDPEVPPADALDVIHEGQGALTIGYDMPGAASECDFEICKVGETNPIRVVSLRQQSTSDLLTLPVGRYSVARRLTLKVGQWQQTVLCNPQSVIVTQDQPAQAKFEWTTKDLVTVKDQWNSLSKYKVPGAFLTVHVVQREDLDTGNPINYFDFEAPRHFVTATTCGPDGKYQLEPLPIGHYVVALRAFPESVVNGQPKHSLPYLVGAEKVHLILNNGHSFVSRYPNESQIDTRWNVPLWWPAQVRPQVPAARLERLSADHAFAPIRAIQSEKVSAEQLALADTRFALADDVVIPEPKKGRLKEPVAEARRLNLTGFVYKSDGTPAIGATVIAIRTNARDAPADDQRQTTQTDERGDFGIQLNGTAGGNAGWWIVATHDDESGTLDEVMTILPQQGDEALPLRMKYVDTVIRLTAGRTISGTVFHRATRKPVALAKVYSSQGQFVRTDAKGRFTFRGVPPQVEELLVISPEKVRTRVCVDVAERPRAEIDIFLEPAATIFGQVLDQQGQPVPYAHVGRQTTLQFVAPLTVIADRQRRFEYEGIPFGRLNMPLTVSHARFVDANEEMFAVRETEPTHTIDLKATAVPARPVAKRMPRAMALGVEESTTGTIRGHVIDPQGNPVRNFSVILLPIMNNTKHDSGSFSNATRQFSDNDGRFVIGRLQDHRRYRVAVAADGFGRAIVESVFARTADQWMGDEELHFLLTPPHHLQVRVVDFESRQPIPDVMIGLLDNRERAAQFDWNYSRQGALVRWTSPSGEAAFRDLSAEQSPLFIDQPGYARQQVYWQDKVDRATMSDFDQLEIAVQPETRLRIRFANLGERSPRGLHVDIISDLQGRFGSNLVGATDPPELGVSRLPPGKTSLQLLDAHAQSPWAPLVELDVELKPGDNDVVLTLPK